jgi:uncharacterized membrane protein
MKGPSIKKSKNNFKRDALLVGIFLVLSFVLFRMPTGFEKRVEEQAVRSRGRVLAVDNSRLIERGVVKAGEQGVTLRILDGPFKGREVSGNNPLRALMDRDKIFAVGDTALVVLSLDEKGEIIFVNPQDHYRLGLELLLLGLFSLALILFGGWIGAKALLSFLFAALMLWKVLVPFMLKGYNPVLISLAVVTVLTGVIMFLVAGATRKGIVAFLGAILGVLTSCVMAIYFTKAFHAHGAVMPFTQTLLYAGFSHLNLTEIYIAAVFIAASGAVMDLAMDVATSMDELVSKKSDITVIEAITSGFRMGRAVVGTMVTTLLFAYSGGYITVLMAYMAQGVPLANLFSFIYVATQVLKTLVGSFGLVMVAPFTAIVGGLLLVPRRGIGREKEERGL